MINQRQRTVLIIGLALLLAACLPQEPIYIYITPTPEPGTPVPTVEATEALTVLVLSDNPAPTPTPTSASVSSPGDPTPTVLGAVFEPGYTLPPTSTPSATSAPTIGPSATPHGPTSTPLPGLDPNLMGIQLDPTLNQDDWNLAMQDIRRLGVKWLKVQVAWAMLQPNGADEISEDFRRLEIYLETASNDGLNILVSVAKAPAWARDTQAEDGPPRDPNALAAFMSLMLREFGTAVDAVEVWNEPNLQREWQGKPMNGGEYMNLFRPAYEAIRRYSADITIITAGLAPTGDNTGSVDDRTYLQQMYNAGLASYGDVAVGIHPYGWGNAPDARCCDLNPEPGWDDDPHFFFLNNLEDYRALMVNNGHASARLWATEFGWATWADLPGSAPERWMESDYVDECQQGDYIVRAFKFAQEQDYIGPMILWNLNFGMLAGLVESGDERAGYSLIIPRGIRERAAYWMLYDAISTDIPQLESYSVCPGSGGE
ncbi:MAG: hypothetical protein HXY41_03215 [Chloroflexi bacterium]|nr:hypothetical protein [Chloroflexota bacterium]